MKSTRLHGKRFHSTKAAAQAAIPPAEKHRVSGGRILAIPGGPWSRPGECVCDDLRKVRALWHDVVDLDLGSAEHGAITLHFDEALQEPA